MPTARKLPSGAWRCQVMRNGMRKSFTVQDPTPNGKRKCERLASQWSESIPVTDECILLQDAIERYISSKENTISPTTLRSYRMLKRTAYDDINIPLNCITEEVLQKWVNRYSKDHTPKTVRNAHALISSTMKMFRIPFPTVTLPEKRPPELGTPTDNDIQTLLREVQGTDMEKCIMLSAFGTLRRGEICGLLKSDIGTDTITVRRSVVRSEDEWVTKAPKTPQSVRTIALPKNVIKVLMRGDSEKVVNLDPDDVSYYFDKTRKHLGLPKFRFHDLRAYAASIRHALGIPNVYIQADGGWKSEEVLNRIYRRQMDDKRKEFASVVNGHFDTMLKTVTHEFAHEN